MAAPIGEPFIVGRQIQRNDSLEIDRETGKVVPADSWGDTPISGQVAGRAYEKGETIYIYGTAIMGESV